MQRLTSLGSRCIRQAGKPDRFRLVSSFATTCGPGRTERRLLPFENTSYNGVAAQILAEEPMQATQFERQLEHSVAAWTENGHSAIWLKVASERSDLLPIILNNGFEFHHALPGQSATAECSKHALTAEPGFEKGYIMLTNWLLEPPNSLPVFATHQVGAAGFVVNDRREVLVIKETSTVSKQLWKLPGGLVDVGEDLHQAAIREVYEETGVLTEFKALLALRHQPLRSFGRSDIYSVFRLKPVSDTIDACSREVAVCRWMPLDEFARKTELHPVNQTLATLVNDACPTSDTKDGLIDLDALWSCDVPCQAVPRAATGQMDKVYLRQSY